MRSNIIALLVPALLVTFEQNRAETIPPVASSSDEDRTKIDACALVTAEEVGAIQQATMTSRQGSENSDGNFLTSQCYLASKDPDKSVSIVVIQQDPAQKSTRRVSDFWHEAFARFEGNEQSGQSAHEKRPGQEKRKAGEERDDNELQAERVKDLGEEAFWSGGKMGGVLYVLKHDLIVRIGFGGPGTPEEKLDKCKALAGKVLSRL
jgi:hypothetical protein